MCRRQAMKCMSQVHEHRGGRGIHFSHGAQALVQRAPQEADAFLVPLHLTVQNAQIVLSICNGDMPTWKHLRLDLQSVLIELGCLGVVLEALLNVCQVVQGLCHRDVLAAKDLAPNLDGLRDIFASFFEVAALCGEDADRVEGRRSVEVVDAKILPPHLEPGLEKPIRCFHVALELVVELGEVAGEANVKLRVPRMLCQLACLPKHGLGILP
mmetsp:Transcript_41160/g.76619  ORF Transcript_41160/g.76619 Transcript_41160/m.76619 type:complete len:212 (-) Transcript_41160:413-1048(-)